MKAKKDLGNGTKTLTATFLVLLVLIAVAALVVFFSSRETKKVLVNENSQEEHIVEFTRAQREYAEAKGYDAGPINVEGFNSEDSQEIIGLLSDSQEVR